MHKTAHEIRTYIKQAGIPQALSNTALGAPRIRDNDAWQNVEMFSRLGGGAIGSGLGTILTALALLPDGLRGKPAGFGLLGAGGLLGGLAGARLGGYLTEMSRRAQKVSGPSLNAIEDDQSLLPGWTGSDEAAANYAKHMAIQRLHSALQQGAGNEGAATALNYVGMPLQYGMFRAQDILGSLIPR